MKVLKFGGTSVGSPERMAQVANLIEGEAPCIVVLSAVSGTTNQLQALADILGRGEQEQAERQLADLQNAYRQFADQLLPDPQERQLGEEIMTESWQAIANTFALPYAPAVEKVILAQGELLSTRLFQLYLESRQQSPVLLPALQFMRLRPDLEPDMEYLRSRLQLLLEAYPGQRCFITQGYICRNAHGEIDNLQRGGSDYTATLIGAAIGAEEIQIWTDIDGIHNNDPRVVEHTDALEAVSYREAAELAYFGAKILHPTCVIPAEQAGIPLRLKYTFVPEAPGTLISRKPSGRKVAALAAKDGITAIKIRSGRMLNAYGFLRRVFEVFETYETPIDMITTSEVAVSLTVDKTDRLEAIIPALEVFGEVSVDRDQTIVCIVGDGLMRHSGITAEVFNALRNVPIRMVSYGGSNNNISILVPADRKAQVLQQLHQALFALETV